MKKDQEPLVQPLNMIIPADIEHHGGKATNLARLHSKGYQIPQGFSISSINFSLLIETTPEIKKTITQIEETEDFEKIVALSEKIQGLILGHKIPDELRQEIATHYNRIHSITESTDLGYAVRSSATIEDRKDISFAGQADTYLCVRGMSEIIDAVKQVWRSSFSPSAVIYLKTKEIPLSRVKMAVVVQEMIPAEISGVMFTANVVNNNTSEMLVNATWGWGEALVSGKVIPDTYIVKKDPLQVIHKNLGNKEHTCVPSQENNNLKTILEDTPQHKRERYTLGQDELFDLVRIGLKIERDMEGPQDIEWCIKPDGTLTILQTRPITTLKCPS